MHFSKFILGPFTIIGLCSGFAVADAASSYSATLPALTLSSDVNSTADFPYLVAKLQGDVLALQGEVNDLLQQDGQDPSDPAYSFSIAPPPNHDGAPIPNGDYGDGA
jgi:hypothetical protein